MKLAAIRSGIAATARARDGRPGEGIPPQAEREKQNKRYECWKCVTSMHCSAVEVIATRKVHCPEADKHSPKYQKGSGPNSE